MTPQHNPRAWAVLNAAGLGFALFANGLANALPLNGRNTGELSALYPNLFVPAALTFSIWGLIYLGLIAVVVYGFAGEASENRPSVLEALGPWFLVSCLANGAWIFAWHWQLVGLSLGIMLVILGSLVAMYLRLGIGRRPTTTGETWAVRVPVSVYLGWITVATVANTTALAVDLGAPSFGQGPAMLTVAVLAAVVAITGAVLRTRRDLAFALVVVWAFVGIVLRRSGAPEVGSALVHTAATGGLVVVVLALLATARVRLREGLAR
jgi:hypothetical protein